MNDSPMPPLGLGTYRLADLREEGVVDHVGVSNFTPDLLAEARDAVDVPIVANQVELHPLLQQEELRGYADATDFELAETDVEIIAGIDREERTADPDFAPDW